MNTFAVVTGVVSLIAFALQVRDVFPQYRKYYERVTLVFGGFTAGLCVTSFTNLTLTAP